MSMMEFMILQGNSMSINTINYKEACMQREKREVQDEITTVTEQMQDYEDQTDYIVTTEKNNAQRDFDLTIKSLQEDTSKAYQLQNDFKTEYDRCSEDTKTAKEAWETAKGTSQESEAKAAYTAAVQLEAKAKVEYDKASKNYQTKSAENLEAQKTANTNYQNKSNQIEQDKKTMKSVYERDMKANLKQLNKEDARIELSLNELNAMKEMYKSEKDSAKEAVSQQAQDLAPKYS